MLTVSDQMIPSIGDQVEQTRAGITRIGRVWYADQLQVLVKWDDGKSSSLRIGRDPFRARSSPAANGMRPKEHAVHRELAPPQESAA
jgi:hypothetical protein